MPGIDSEATDKQGNAPKMDAKMFLASPLPQNRSDTLSVDAARLASNEESA
jgi:hypothetical protein